MILKDFMSLCVFYEFMCTPFCQKVYIEFIHLAKKFKLKFYEFMCKHFCQKFLFAISANIKFYDFEWFYEFTHLVKKFKLKFYEFMCKPFCQKFLFAICFYVYPFLQKCVHLNFMYLCVHIFVKKFTLKAKFIYFLYNFLYLLKQNCIILNY